MLHMLGGQLSKFGKNAIWTNKVSTGPAQSALAIWRNKASACKRWLYFYLSFSLLHSCSALTIGRAAACIPNDFIHVIQYCCVSAPSRHCLEGRGKNQINK